LRGTVGKAKAKAFRGLPAGQAGNPPITTDSHKRQQIASPPPAQANAEVRCIARSFRAGNEFPGPLGPGQNNLKLIINKIK